VNKLEKRYLSFRRGNFMRKMSIEERAVKLAHYIIETEDTVRGAAKKFGISKSTVHKDVSQRLLNINYALALEVRKVLDENKAERHIRGGMATKLKYSHIEEKKNVFKKGD
jgi:putative DeoR family transcriptional regulator (stage III sporulation protein D)